MFFLASKGFRCIAHDRRGHGRSGQPSEGNEMDTNADDLAALLKQLDLKIVVLIGFSTGGGEVARYIGRHGTKRVAKAVLVSAVPPLMVKTESNPGGYPWRYSTAFAPPFSLTVPSSSKMSRAVHFSASIVRGPRFHKA
jgi:non-heme chloroperoxidase